LEIGVLLQENRKKRLNFIFFIRLNRPKLQPK